MNAAERLKKLDEYVTKIVTNGTPKSEFIAAFETVLRVVGKTREELIARIHTELAAIQGAVKDGKDGRDGKDGESVVGPPGPRGLQGEQGVPGLDGLDGKDGSPDTPKQVRDKLEMLEGKERLDKSAIRGIEELEERVEKKTGNNYRLWGAKGFTLYINGQKKLLTAQTLNIVPGVGVSVTYDFAHGRNDVTINASASTSVLEATGTIDDSNVDFTFTAEPAILVINGASYRSTGGPITWSYAGGTVTLSSPVGVSGDIYGLR